MLTAVLTMLTMLALPTVLAVLIVLTMLALPTVLAVLTMLAVLIVLAVLTMLAVLTVLCKDLSGHLTGVRNSSNNSASVIYSMMRRTRRPH